MKIAYIFNTFPLKSETFLAREVEAMRKLGVEIEIFALEVGEGARKIEKPSAIFRALPSGFWRKVGHDLASEIRGEGFSLVHGAWANHVAEIAQGTAKSLDLPWSFAAHARDLWVEGGDLGAKIQSASAAFCCSRRGFEFLRNHAKTEAQIAKIHFAPHGLDLENWPFSPPQFPDSHGEIRVLGVGRLVAKKGWKNLIQAAQFSPTFPQNVRVQIVGEGPLRGELERESARISGASFEFLGAKTSGEVRAAMRNAHVLVLPSIRDQNGDRDGLANVLLEAAALGVPLVTTDAGSARDLVDETTGILLENAAPRELAGAIAEVFATPETTRTRCEAARKRVENGYCLEANARAMRAVFQSVSGQSVSGKSASFRVP